MWFKNLTVFSLPINYALTAQDLNSYLNKVIFTECLSGDMSSEGFVSPRDNDLLVHTVNNQYLLKFMTEKKLLPSSVINQVTKARAQALEEEQGFAPGRKAMKDLKEQITEELLPRAFSVQSVTNVWLDPVNGWLVIDSASTTKVDDIIKFLLRAIQVFPLRNLKPNLSPQTAMTDWLAGNEAPNGFTIDQDTELRAHTEDKATVRYVRHTLNQDDIQHHIASGKQCTKLALTWNDRISFVLDQSLTIKKIRALDIITEDDDLKTADADERFDADFTLMTAELDLMLSDILFALGGEADGQKDLVIESAKVAA